jgi:hypothetical protein
LEGIDQRFSDALATLRDVPCAHRELQRVRALEWLENQRKAWRDDMRELQQSKRGLQFDLTNWYHWRAIQNEYQKEPDQATVDLARLNTTIKERSASVSSDSPRDQFREAHKESW